MTVISIGRLSSSYRENSCSFNSPQKKLPIESYYIAMNTSLKLRALLLCLLLNIPISQLSSQSPYTPSRENLQAREKFRNYGLGIFLHWGIYSSFAQGEWYLNDGKLNHKEYAKAASGFYPALFDADRWVKQIKASGAGYLCITARHHDSFSMWATKQSDYNIVKASPYKRDILAELRDACRREGLGFHIYYSLLDWAREDYYPLGQTGHHTGRKSVGKWERYNDFMNAQLSELVRDYGADAIWLDGSWDKDKLGDFDWQYEAMYRNIHRLNSACLIGNNHHKAPIEGEDFQMFERDVPGANTAGFSGQAIGELPLETCETMNGMWGYRVADQNYKSVAELIRLLVSAAGRNANLLLNIGPEANGNLPQTAVERMQDIGKWLQVYAPTVKDGVRAGSVLPQPWGVSTQRGNTLYLHILNCQERELSIDLPQKVRSAVEYHSSKTIKHKQSKGTLRLTFDDAPSRLNPTDYVVELTLKAR